MSYLCGRNSHFQSFHGVLQRTRLYTISVNTLVTLVNASQMPTEMQTLAKH